MLLIIFLMSTEQTDTYSTVEIMKWVITSSTNAARAEVFIVERR
jgi:hypothetical protein